MTSSVVLRDVRGATFRANPQYELILFERLPADQQSMLADLRKDPDLYGILRPRGPSGLGVKSVCRDTALLYLTLQQPGGLPAYVKDAPGGDVNGAMVQLVLDSVLEIQAPDPAGEVAYLSGSEAYPLLYEDSSGPGAGGKLARLSIDALRYAQALEIDDAGKLSARLYFYNRRPASPRWLRRLPTPEAVLDWLGAGEGGPRLRALDRAWSRLPQPPSDDGWNVWRRRTRARRPAASVPGYKLYVSPACEAVPEAFDALTDVLASTRASRFKIGRDAYGILRPDKIVAYFSSFEDVAEAAEGLRRRLAGCPAHGVPFTAELTEDGLLSWGMDPPRDQRTFSWQEYESWRLWLTNRLATALVLARSGRTAAIEPWRFAIQRMALENVDVSTWTPARSIWGGEAARG